MRKELLERAIEEPNRDGPPVHGIEHFDEVVALGAFQLREPMAPLVVFDGEQSALHREQTLRGEEHALGAAQTDAFGAVAQRSACRLRRVRLGVDAHSPRFVGPRHELRELVHRRRRHDVERSCVDLPARSVDRQQVTLLEDLVA